GFLGAGTILFLKPGTVKGLTTASGLWTIAGIGLATGGGMYFAAGAATAIALLILWGMQVLQKKFTLKGGTKSLRVIASNKSASSQILESLWEFPSLEVTNFSVNTTSDGVEVDLALIGVSKNEMPLILDKIQHLPGVSS